MSRRSTFVAHVVAVLLLLLVVSHAYPPGVGIMGNSKSCVSCHVDNGPWKDDSSTIVDIIDKESGNSLLQPDSTFLIKVTRFEKRSVLTVIGRQPGDTATAPYRIGWHFIDLNQIGSSALSKFAPGWSVDLPLACRLIGDKNAKYPDANVTVLPMTLRPLDDAADATIELQILLTTGQSVKGDAKKGLTSSYLTRKVKLKVKE